jgi:hypothetical protein
MLYFVQYLLEDKSAKMLGAPFKPYFGLSGIMAVDVPPPVCRSRPGEMRYRVLRHLAGKRSSHTDSGVLGFLLVAPIRFACAVFGKESRMRFDNATKLYRKSGGGPR